MSSFAKAEDSFLIKSYTVEEKTKNPKPLLTLTAHYSTEAAEGKDGSSENASTSQDHEKDGAPVCILDWCGGGAHLIGALAAALGMGGDGQ